MTIKIVVIINNFDIYEKATRKLVSESGIESILIDNRNNKQFKSASSALNYVIEDNVKEDIILSMHQDVFGEWGEFLEYLKKWEDDWGIVGIAGKAEQGGVEKNLWGYRFNKPLKVQILDECCFAFKRDSGLRFDEINFDSWHAYCKDLCYQAMLQGKTNYLLPHKLTHGYADSIKYLGYPTTSLTLNHDEQKIYYDRLCKKYEGMFPYILDT